MDIEYLAFHHHKARLAEIERDHLAQLAMQSWQPNSRRSLRARLGHSLIVVGRWLQNRYEPEFDAQPLIIDNPCVPDAGNVTS